MQQTEAQLAILSVATLLLQQFKAGALLQASATPGSAAPLQQPATIFCGFSSSSLPDFVTPVLPPAQHELAVVALLVSTLFPEQHVLGLAFVGDVSSVAFSTSQTFSLVETQALSGLFDLLVQHLSAQDASD